MIVVSRAHGNSQVEVWQFVPDAVVAVSLLAREMLVAHQTLIYCPIIIVSFGIPGRCRSAGADLMIQVFLCSSSSSDVFQLPL